MYKQKRSINFSFLIVHSCASGLSPTVLQLVGVLSSLPVKKFLGGIITGRGVRVLAQFRVTWYLSLGSLSDCSQLLRYRYLLILQCEYILS